MDIYEVFIDTNIYDGANFSFGNPDFSTLKKLISQGHVILLMNSVIEGEIRSHIEVRIKKAIKVVNENLNDRIFVPFRYEEAYANKVGLFPKNDMIQLINQRFNEFIDECNAVRISVNGVNVEKILENYFTQKPPFEKVKPEEFKDAIAIESLYNYMDKMPINHKLCVISNDSGFRKAIDSANFLVFTDLKEFLNMVTSKVDIQTTYLKEYIEEKLLDEEIHEQVKAAIKKASYNFDELIDEFSIIDETISGYVVDYINIVDINTADVAITVEVEVKAWVNYIDEDLSYFDKEEWRYFWKTEIEKEEIHNISFELSMKIDISEFGEHVEDEAEIDYSHDCIQILECSDINNTIVLGEDTCTSAEILSHSDPFREDYDEDGLEYRDYSYTYCPDCGNPIGQNNEGGNGFCNNCAWKH